MSKKIVKKANKSKSQITSDLQQVQKANRDKALVKLMFPIIETQKSIYDAQTVLQALSGFIKADLDKRMSEVLVGELFIDLSKEKESPIKSAILELNKMIATEKAKDVSNLLERFGNILAQYSANEYMKGDMKNISLKNIIAE